MSDQITGYPAPESSNRPLGGRTALAVVVLGSLLFSIPFYSAQFDLEEIDNEASLGQYDAGGGAAVLWVLLLVIALAAWLLLFAVGSRILAGKQLRPEFLAERVKDEEFLGHLFWPGIFATPAAIVALTSATAAWLAVEERHNPNSDCQSAADPLECTTIGQLHGKVFYDALDLVPLMRITGTLGWEDPLEDPTAWFGWLLIGMKVLLVIGVVWSIKNLFEISRRRRDERAKPDVSPGTASG